MRGIVWLYGCSVSLDLRTLVVRFSGGSRDTVDHIPNQECSAQGDTRGAGIDLTLMVPIFSKKSPSAGCLSYFIFHLYWLAAVNSIAKVHLIDGEARRTRSDDIEADDAGPYRLAVHSGKLPWA